MGRFRGSRVPDEYSADWESRELLDHQAWWHLGYSDCLLYELQVDPLTKEVTDERITYVKHLEDTNKKLEHENETLRNLMGANVRVIKEELRKELEEDKDPK